MNDYWADYCAVLYNRAKKCAVKKEYGGRGDIKVFNRIMAEIELIESFMPVFYYGC